MLGKDENGDVTAYGPWAWIFGYVAAGGIAALMFGLATGFL